MDEAPFFEVNLFDLKEHHIEGLKKFTKSSFDLEKIINDSRELKYKKEIKQILESQLNEPEEGFIRFFAQQVYSGRMTESVKNQFSQVVKDTFRQFIKDKIFDRLRAAEAADSSQQTPSAPSQVEENNLIENQDNKIVTTEFEMEGYYIIKSIVAKIGDSSRVIMRDKVNFCSILLDDNNRKHLCKLYFNDEEKLQLMFYNEPNPSERIDINHVSDIYKHEGRIIGAYHKYENNDTHTSSPKGQEDSNTPEQVKLPSIKKAS